MIRLWRFVFLILALTGVAGVVYNLLTGLSWYPWSCLIVCLAGMFGHEVCWRRPENLDTDDDVDEVPA